MKINPLFPKPLFKILSFLLISTFTYAQKSDSFMIGTKENFSNKLLSAAEKTSSIILKLPDLQSIAATITAKKIHSEHQYFVTGTINNIENSSFSIYKTEGKIEGSIILLNQNKGYKYTSNEHDQVFIESIALDKLLLIR